MTKNIVNIAIVAELSDGTVKQVLLDQQAIDIIRLQIPYLSKGKVKVNEQPLNLKIDIHEKPII